MSAPSAVFWLFCTAIRKGHLFAVSRARWAYPLLALWLLALPAAAEEFAGKLSAAAMQQTLQEVRYDGSYYAIGYPNGDVPAHLGVCTDVVIRAYRALGTDLQQLVHEDIAANFGAYPSERLWGLKRPDTNIDHRRVPNLQTFFARKGTSLAVSEEPRDYKTGDIVTWLLPGNLPHIGIVSHIKSGTTGNPKIVHNIGSGPELEDMLFAFPITGHYRYFPQQNSGGEIN